jgi:RNA polymerase sigma-70 factor (ECF subfamily)
MATAAGILVERTELVKSAADGDREAFRAIVEAEGERVYRIALGLVRDHHDAEEVVQDTFLRAFRSLGRFRGDAALSSWLYRITINAAHEHRRRRQRWGRSLVAVDPLPEPVEDRPGGDPERLAAAGSLRAEIDRALLSLSERERTVFILRHDGGLKIREIAAVLGRAEGTVKNLLFRAVRKLRTALAHHLEVAP